MKNLHLAMQIGISRTKRHYVSLIQTTLYLTAEFLAGLLCILFIPRGLAGIYTYQWIRRIDDIVDGEIHIDEPVLDFVRKKKEVLKKALRGVYEGTDKYDELLFTVCKRYKSEPDLIHQINDFLETFEHEISIRKFAQHAPVQEEYLDTLAKKWELVTFSYACLIAKNNFHLFYLKTEGYHGLLQKIDWFTDLEQDLTSSFVYFSDMDLKEMGLTFDKLKNYADMHILRNSVTYATWHKKKAQALLVELQKLKEKAGAHPFNSWILDTLYYRLIIARWEGDLRKAAIA